MKISDNHHTAGNEMFNNAGVNGYGNKKRVVITGLGPVSCIGIGKTAFWNSVRRGVSGIDRITAFDPTPYPSRIGGEVRDFQPELFMSDNTAKTAARFAQFAVAAARLAIDDSGLDLKSAALSRIGACFGSSALGLGDRLENSIPKFYEKGLKTIPPLTCVDFTNHVATAYVCIENNLQGPNSSVSSGCSTALDTIMWGYRTICQGMADIVVVGAADAPLFPFAFGTLCAVRVLSRRNHEPQRASRPYDRNRDGMVLSEGGSSVVLEDLNHALQRRAHIYAEVTGINTTCEANQTVRVETSGETLAGLIKKIVRDANLPVEEIDYINSHGNSMRDYDVCETRAFKAALGEHAYRIPVSSIKSMMGQSLAPAAGFQVISSCLTFRDNLIPPTINYEKPDPECDLDYVPNQARFNRVNTILMNSHSVGGTHSALIIKRWETTDRS